MNVKGETDYKDQFSVGGSRFSVCSWEASDPISSNLAQSSGAGIRSRPRERWAYRLPGAVGARGERRRGFYVLETIS